MTVFQPIFKIAPTISVFDNSKNQRQLVSLIYGKCLSVNNYLTFVVALENIRIITVMWRWIQPDFSLTLSKCTLQISFLYTSQEPLSMHVVKYQYIQRLFLTWLIHKVPKKETISLIHMLNINL